MERLRIALCATLVAIAAWAPAAARGAEGFFDSDGVRIRYTDEGAGPPVVLIHGFMASGDLNWRIPGVIRLLAKDYRVITLDNRGHGKSDKPTDVDDYGPKMAQDVLRLLDHLKIAKAHFVGYSMGGLITMKLATIAPDRMLSAVIGGMGWLKEGSAVPDPKGRRGTSPPLRACAHAFPTLGITRQELAAINLPLMVVVGTNDRLIKYVVDPFREARPDVPVTMVPGANHINCVFRAEFRNAITEFLAKQVAASTAATAPAKTRPLFAFCIDPPVDELKDLGYSGYGHLWLPGVDQRAAALTRQGLRLFQVYVRADLSKPEPIDKKAIDQVLPALKPHRTQLAMLITGGKPSDPTLDDQAVALLNRVADRAKPYGVSITLYPHTNDWLEKTSDCVRLAKKINRPGEVGVMFNLCHWMKADPNRDLRAVLAEAKPWLAAVSLSGSDTPEQVRAGKGNWIQPLGQGSYDVRQLLKLLAELNYDGPVGLQCYGLKGDPRAILAQSKSAWDRLTASLP
ncbi:MAG: alpha/beta fold hydrolase [Phycisphaerae bacterium]|nr:alpha/beta fold hydrolase [Phycisphaerae bacterium]